MNVLTTFIGALQMLYVFSLITGCARQHLGECKWKHANSGTHACMTTSGEKVLEGAFLCCLSYHPVSPHIKQRRKHPHFFAVLSVKDCRPATNGKQWKKQWCVFVHVVLSAVPQLSFWHWMAHIWSSSSSHVSVSWYPLMRHAFFCCCFFHFYLKQ